jgi:HD-like signal output (HDOD) protein/GGDEF domain-containing protein
MNEFERRVLASPSVPTLPTVAQRILELVSDERSDLAQLASVISCDPSLSARVLGLVNSPLYRLQRKIVSLREAVLYLGMNAVRSVALSFSLVSGLRAKGAAAAGLDELWRTSLMNALAARRLATEAGGWDPEEAFLAGLLADVGAMLLYKQAPGYADLVSRFRAGPTDLLDLERAELETDHTRLVMLLLQKWSFPESFARVLGAQHDPSLVPAGTPEEQQARILNAAWLCARALTVPGFAAQAAALDQHVAVLLGLSPALVRAVAAEIPDELRETARFFDFPAGEQKSFEQLLEEANSALGSLALSVESAAPPPMRAVMEEQWSADEVSQEIADVMAREGCDAFASRSAFERIVEVVHRRARETHNALAVAVVDFSDLKLEGDLEPFVEQIVMELCSRAAQSMRPSDRLARLARHRLAFLLPGCPPDALRRTASRVQQSLEGEPLELACGPIECRVALGAAASLPGRDGIDPRTLLSLANAAADRALATADRVIIAT